MAPDAARSGGSAAAAPPAGAGTGAGWTPAGPAPGTAPRPRPRPRRPARRPPPAYRRARAPGAARRRAPAARRRARTAARPAPPAPDTTGHIQLPPGGPVPLPRRRPPPAAPARHDPRRAAHRPGRRGQDHRRPALGATAAGCRPRTSASTTSASGSAPASPTRSPGWNDHSEAQYRLARRTCGFAARNFLANGISCILDDAVFPDRPVVGLGGWKRHVGPGLLPVVLLPGLEIVLERNADRSGNRRLSDEEVARIHGRMAGWYGSGLPIIDNSTYDVETTARVLDDVLARSIASPPAW